MKPLSTRAKGPLLGPLLYALALAAAYVALLPQQALAEFILTASSGVYQSADGRTKVILSHREGAQGIFVVHFSEGVPPQEFNPETAPVEGAAHVFVRFDPTSEHQYSEVIIGQRSYKVSGNLNIWLTPNGGVSVNIDNTNPFMTITQRSGNGRDDSLVGFYGLTEVVKGAGNLATILTANQLSPELAKILKPYTVAPNGLALNGKDVTTPSVGLFVSREHECTKSSQAVSVLTLAQLKSIQAAKSEAQQAQLLERYLQENRAKSPIQGHLILRAERSGPMILLNIATKDIVDMRAIKNSFSNRKICVISPIQ
jgi:hypothetical protein